MQGAPDYGGYHFGGWNVLAASLVEHVGVLRGGLGGSNPVRTGSWEISGRDLAAEVARVSPKTPEGTERQRARGATHSGLEDLISNNGRKPNIF